MSEQKTLIFFMIQNIIFRKIKFQGKTLPVGEWEPLEQLQIAIQNLSDDEVELFCRRIEPLYQDYEEFTPKVLPLKT